jgi:phage-related protein
MKPIRFLGDSLKAIREFPAEARRSAGFELLSVQRGVAPRDSKPMPSIGKGVEEIRVWDESGTFRVVYTARIEGAVYVLHAFQKKTQQTSKRDIDTARARFVRIGRFTP